MNFAKWVFRDSSGYFIENFEKYCSGISSFLPLSQLIFWEDIRLGDIRLGGYKIGGILSWEKMQLLKNYSQNFCKILQENALSLTNSRKILQHMFESCKFFAKSTQLLQNILQELYSVWMNLAHNVFVIALNVSDTFQLYVRVQNTLNRRKVHQILPSTVNYACFLLCKFSAPRNNKMQNYSLFDA